jgi:hypothetical protein
MRSEPVWSAPRLRFCPTYRSRSAATPATSRRDWTRLDELWATRQVHTRCFPQGDRIQFDIGVTAMRSKGFARDRVRPTSVLGVLKAFVGYRKIEVPSAGDVARNNCASGGRSFSIGREPRLMRKEIT